MIDLVKIAVGVLVAGACGCVPDAAAQAVSPLPPGMSYYREMRPDEVEAWRGPSSITLTPDRVIAYRVGDEWFQAGVNQCIPEGSSRSFASPMGAAAILMPFERERIQ